MDAQGLRLITALKLCILATKKDGTPLYSGNTALRSKGLYESDRSNKIRKCHENSSLKAIYEKYLTLPCSNTAHKYLHTYYTKR
jgi:NADH-quinone oxidoreductase subunit G